MKKKIVTVIGARPQFIKAAAVSRAIKDNDAIEELLIHTGQHYDSNMSGVFFEQMHIPKPNYNLGVSGLSHGAMTGQMLEKIEEILVKEKPERVMVYGDTNSTLAGALAASKLHIPIAHVEAGLRSFNMQMPEEINRILTDRVSDKLLCPTDAAVKNLQAEGYENFENVQIIKTGDVMQDAALYYSEMAQAPDLKDSKFSLEAPFALATLHRAENTDDPQRLRDIFNGIVAVSRNLPIVLPLHPRTRQKLADIGIDANSLGSSTSGHLVFIDPVGYLEMVYLIKNCQLVLTDSGGLQKEAFFFGKPCLTLRDQTEWIELVEHGVNILVGSDRDLIIEAASKMINVEVFDPHNLYGGGDASINVVRALLN